MTPKSQITGYQRAHGSPSHHSHQKRGIAATIQFHPGATGLTHGGGRFHLTIAGHQKHTAIHPAQVRVGVTNIRTKFVGEVVQSDQPAHGHQQNGHGTKVAELAGYTDGRQHGLVPHEVCLQVRAENTGTPSLTLRPSHTGIPKRVGSFHGARGAQLRGFAKQLPPPNQQLSHSIISSISAAISSTLALILLIAHIKSIALLVESILSSISGI